MFFSLCYAPLVERRHGSGLFDPRGQSPHVVDYYIDSS